MPDPTGKFSLDSPHTRFYRERVDTRSADLKNQAAPLLDSVTPDPDVIIERWPSRQSWDT